MKAGEESSERTLLAVAYFFPPLGGGGVQRTVKFLKYLRPLGWRSEVVTARARSYWVVDDTLGAEVPPDTVVHRTSAPSGLDLLALLGRGGGASPRAPGAAVRSTTGFRAWRALAGFFLIPDAYAGWFPFALAKVRERLAAGGIDVLFTTSSPDTAHLVGLVVREQLGIPWVADFRDPWVRRLTFTAPTPLHARLQTWLERRVLTRADRVLVTNEATRDDFLGRHPRLPADKVIVIPNGYDPDDVAAVREGAAASAATAVPNSPGAALVLVHTGLLSGRRTLAPLVAAITALLARRPELRARLRVRQIGPRESVNEEMVAAAGLGDVIRFEPPRPHAEVLAEMARAPALLLLEADEPRGSLITPGKIFEYLAIGRPILALVPPGPAADLVIHHQAGEVASPGDTNAIARHLERWITHGPPPVPTPGPNLGEYARPALAAKLARVLDDLAVSLRGSSGL